MENINQGTIIHKPNNNINNLFSRLRFFKIINNENITLKSKGDAIRSFCYIADAITGFFTILLKGKNAEAYNLANENATVSIKTLAETLVNLFPDKNLKVVMKTRSKNDNYSESKIKVNRPDISKLTSLGWKPYFSIKEGFKRTIISYINL